MKNKLVSVVLTGPASPLTTSYVATQGIDLAAYQLDLKLGVDVVVNATKGDADSIETKLQASEDGISWFDLQGVGDVLEYTNSADADYVMRTGPVRARWVRAAAKATGADVDPSSVVITLYGRLAEGNELQSHAGGAASWTARASAEIVNAAASSDTLDLSASKVWKDVGVEWEASFTKGSLTSATAQIDGSYDGGTNWIPQPQLDGTVTQSFSAATDARMLRTGPTVAGLLRLTTASVGTQTSSDLVVTARWNEGR